MIKLFGAVLAASFALPALAQTNDRVSGQAALQSKAQAQPAKTKVKKTAGVVATRLQSHRVPAYSTNPEYDVFVNGVYVGSDPDPRIRATLRRDGGSQIGLE